MHHFFKKALAALCSGVLLLQGVSAMATAQGQPILGYVSFSETGAYEVLFETSPDTIEQEGWYTPDDGMNFQYYYEDGTRATGVVTLPDGLPYVFSPSGIQKLYWQQVDENRRFYYNPINGRALTGWIAYQGREYYVTAEDGKVTDAVCDVDGVLCWFDEFGQLQTGIQTYPDGTVHQVGEKGVPVTGFATDEAEQTYYFDETGTAVTGEMKLGMTLYTFDETGVLISEQSTGIAYDVPYFAQADPKWGNVYIGSKTIAKVGCLTCCMAMMHSYYTGTTITPDVMCKQYLTYSDNSLLWAKVYALGYQVEDVSGKGTANNLSLLYKRLQTGPVIVGATNSYGGMHYVLVTGCTKPDGNNLTTADFTVHDPGYTNKSTLNQHFADYGNWYQFYDKA